MQRIAATTPHSAPPGSQHALAAVVGRMGRVLNIHATMAASPAVISAYDALSRSIQEHGTFDGRTREAIALTVASVNDCGYCQAAHTALGTRAGLSPEQMIAIRRGEPIGDALLDTLCRVTREATASTGSVTDRTWDAALDAGWHVNQLAETFVHLIANTFTNYFNHYAHTELDLPPAPAA